MVVVLRHKTNHPIVHPHVEFRIQDVSVDLITDNHRESLTEESADRYSSLAVDGAGDAQAFRHGHAPAASPLLGVASVASSFTSSGAPKIGTRTVTDARRMSCSSQSQSSVSSYKKAQSSS